MHGTGTSRTGEAEPPRCDVKLPDAELRVSGGSAGTLVALLRRDDLAVAYLL